MNRKLKASLLVLGVVAGVLILTQLGLGLAIVRAGGQGGDTQSLRGLIKAHQHSGYLTVTVVVAYIALSLGAIRSVPGRPAAG